MKHRKVLSVAIMLAVVISCMPLINGKAYATTKKSAAPTTERAKGGMDESAPIPE